MEALPVTIRPLLIVLASLFAAAVNAEIIRVPEDYPTIQAGIDAAANGDTVIVGDGRYSGQGNTDIDFRGKPITVRSTNGPDACVVDPEGLGRGFNFQSGETAASILDGFTITDGDAEEGAGIRCVGSAPVIRNCRIDGNRAARGAGVYCGERCGITLEACTVSENVSIYWGNEGGGILCERADSLIMDACVLRDNYASYGAAIAFIASDGKLTRCSFEENTAREMGAGVYCLASNPAIEDCDFVENTASVGGAIANEFSSPNIVNCRFSNNVADGSGASQPLPGGGAIWNMEESDAIVTDCTFTGNHAVDRACCGGAMNNLSGVIRVTRSVFEQNTTEQGGGAVFNNAGSETIFTDCLFARNRAVNGFGEGHGGAIANNPGTPTVDGCVFMDNEADGSGGAISDTASDSLVRNSLFVGNKADRGGAVSHSGTRQKLMSCTFVGNQASGRNYDAGGALVIRSHCSTRVDDSVFWANTASRGSAIAVLAGQYDASLTVSHSDVQGGQESVYVDGEGELFWEAGNISVDPRFVEGPLGGYYLSQVASGQNVDSPCLDAGSGTARDMGLDHLSTRTDQERDAGKVDMGYHYPAVVVCNQVSRLSATCKPRRDGFRLAAVVRSTLASEILVSFVLEDGDRRSAFTNGRGKAKVRWENVKAGSHEVCMDACPQLCGEVRCGK